MGTNDEAFVAAIYAGSVKPIDVRDDEWVLECL